MRLHCGSSCGELSPPVLLPAQTGNMMPPCAGAVFRELHPRACILNGGHEGVTHPLPYLRQGIKIRSLVYRQGRVASTFAEANQKTALKWINRLKSSIN